MVTKLKDLVDAVLLKGHVTAVVLVVVGPRRTRGCTAAREALLIHIHHLVWARVAANHHVVLLARVTVLLLVMLVLAHYRIGVVIPFMVMLVGRHPMVVGVLQISRVRQLR